MLNITRARGAGIAQNKACLPNTRVQSLDELASWVSDPNGARVRFLVGGAGTGKSAIAHSIGLRDRQLGRLGSFFCFDRNFQGDRHPESVLSTIARNLACWDPGFNGVLARTLQVQDGLADTTDVDAQWQYLIVEPAKHITFVGPVLIIIDAFDESSS